MPAAPCPPIPVPAPASRSRRRNCQWPASSTSLVVVLAILILVGKQNTTALSAELVDLIGKAGEVLLALLRKALA